MAKVLIAMTLIASGSAVDTSDSIYEKSNIHGKAVIHEKSKHKHSAHKQVPQQGWGMPQLSQEAGQNVDSMIAQKKAELEAITAQINQLEVLEQVRPPAQGAMVESQGRVRQGVRLCNGGPCGSDSPQGTGLENIASAQGEQVKVELNEANAVAETQQDAVVAAQEAHKKATAASESMLEHIAASDASELATKLLTDAEGAKEKAVHSTTAMAAAKADWQHKVAESEKAEVDWHDAQKDQKRANIAAETKKLEADASEKKASELQQKGTQLSDEKLSKEDALAYATKVYNEAKSKHKTANEELLESKTSSEMACKAAEKAQEEAETEMKEHQQLVSILGTADAEVAKSKVNFHTAEKAAQDSKAFFDMKQNVFHEEAEDAETLEEQAKAANEQAENMQHTASAMSDAAKSIHIGGT